MAGSTWRRPRAPSRCRGASRRPIFGPNIWRKMWPSCWRASVRAWKLFGPPIYIKSRSYRLKWVNKSHLFINPTDSSVHKHRRRQHSSFQLFPAAFNTVLSSTKTAPQRQHSTRPLVVVSVITSPFVLQQPRLWFLPLLLSSSVCSLGDFLSLFPLD